MLRFALSLLVVHLSATATLAAGFSGTIEMKMQSESSAGASAGTMRLLVGDAGVLGVSEMSGATGKGARAGIQLKTLMRKDKPGVVVLIDDATKTFQEIDTKAMPKPADDEAWTVKSLGSDKIAGYTSQHVLVTSSRGTEMELWTTREIEGAEAFRAVAEQQRIPGGLEKALAQAKADGFVTKMVSKGKGRDGAMSMELVRVTKGAHPASTFEIPRGYTKATAPGMPGGMPLPPEARKQLEESMKSLTPEQREQMKKMMGGG